MQTTGSSWVSHFIVPCSKNMPAKYCKESSCPFHEIDEQQQSSQPPKQHAFSKIVHESDLMSRLSRQRIVAWPSSSSSSSSSLSTGSLFSLSDSFSLPRRYKTTGIFFGNLDLVPLDPEVDPKPYACFNCWQFDHECHRCPEVKLMHCRNCGRRGVVMNDCPRCARAYVEFLDRLNRQYTAFFGKVGLQESEEKTKSFEDGQLDVIVEGADEECWDDEEDYQSPKASFLDSLQKREADDDWDNYQSPRVDIVEKSSKVRALFATKAEIAKFKDDNWDDNDCSYSWVHHIDTSGSLNFVTAEEKIKDRDEDWGDFNQEASKDTCNSSENKQLETERAEHESECWSNHGENGFKSSWKETLVDQATVFKAATFIPAEKSSLANQNNLWVDLSVEDVFSSPEISFTEHSLLNLENENAQHKEEDWSDFDAYESLENSFCEHFETGNLITILDDDEDYWTDFDDDYKSLQTSFPEEYKSLDNTVEDDNNDANVLTMEFLDAQEESGFYKSFYVSEVAEPIEIISFKYDESSDHFAVENIYEQDCYEFNSLQNSVDSQSEEAYLAFEDLDEYEDIIVDEDERSEPFQSAGHAVQEFLMLLDSVKHLPIQTQNVAVLHYISKCREQSWQSKMHSRI